MDISALRSELLSLVSAAQTLEALEQARLAALGKKGRITDIMKTIGALAAEERKNAGAAINTLRDEVTARLAEQEKILKKQALEQRLSQETLDVTLPPRPERAGHVHPVSQTIEEFVQILATMGFSVAEGPDIEDDWHNFVALNFPPGHPAREMQDTLFLPEDPTESGDHARKLLRTHTSPVQIRHMMTHKPPYRIVVPGRTYRNDMDVTHTPMFHQIEGLYIDRNVNFSHLKGCLTEVVRMFFRIDDLPVRFRPSFFPFTEISAEMDIGCDRTGGALKIGRAGKPVDQQWMEILGCGMVHPNVLKNCGVDPDEWQGFAFGLAADRPTMLKYGIPDLRTFFESDVRWLDHYGFPETGRVNLLFGDA